MKYAEKDSYTIELSSNTRSLDNSYSAVFGNIRSVDAKSQINAEKLNSKGESDVVKGASGREYEDKCDGICILHI